MFHFNTVTRTTHFEQPFVGNGLDHCYDCAAEILILSQYIKQANENGEGQGQDQDQQKQDGQDDIEKRVFELSSEISFQCATVERSLELPDIETHYVQAVSW